MRPLRSQTKNASFDFPGYPNNDDTDCRNAFEASLAICLGSLSVSVGRGFCMPQKASAVKSAPQSEARTHQPGQEVFKPILPDDIDWKPFPAFPPSVRLAVVVGQPSEHAPYTIRVKSPHGAKLMPHKHPEDRVYTVISGVFYIGLGDEFDASKLEAYSPGAVVILLATRPISTGRNPASTSRKSPQWGRLDWNTSAAKDDPRNSNS